MGWEIIKEKVMINFYTNILKKEMEKITKLR